MLALVLDWVFLDIISSIKAFTFLDKDNLVLGRPNTNSLNPSPSIQGHPIVVIGLVMPFFEV